MALIRSIPGSGDRPERLLVMEIRTSNLIGTMSEKFSRQEAVVLLTAQGDTVYINFMPACWDIWYPETGNWSWATPCARACAAWARA